MNLFPFHRILKEFVFHESKACQIAANKMDYIQFLLTTLRMIVLGHLTEILVLRMHLTFKAVLLDPNYFVNFMAVKLLSMSFRTEILAESRFILTMY